jgi:hypothetical protein
MIDVVPYRPALKEDWESLLKDSKNGTFLMSRNFMEYHSDRFSDYSLMIYENGTCSALFPANRAADNTISSHDGLTYGGLVLNKDAFSVQTFLYFSALLEYCHNHGIQKVKVNVSPNYYQSVSSQEFDFACIAAGAEIIKADLTIAADLRSGTPAIQGRRMRGKRKAEKAGVRISEVPDFEEFWRDVLIPNLRENHGVSPVHTLEEIRYLGKLNSPHIRQFNADLNGEVIAGCTIFETDTTAHAQYISANSTGKKFSALDLLFISLMKDVFREKLYFSFGRVNGETWKEINHGLMSWKEGYGARGFLQKQYLVKTESYTRIKKLAGG